MSVKTDFQAAYRFQRCQAKIKYTPDHLDPGDADPALWEEGGAYHNADETVRRYQESSYWLDGAKAHHWSRPAQEAAWASMSNRRRGEAAPDNLDLRLMRHKDAKAWDAILSQPMM